MLHGHFAEWVDYAYEEGSLPTFFYINVTVLGEQPVWPVVSVMVIFYCSNFYVLYDITSCEASESGECTASRDILKVIKVWR